MVKYRFLLYLPFQIELSMNKKLLLYFLLIPGVLAAQNKLLSVEDVVTKQRTTLAPDRLMQLQFLPGTHSYSWVAKQKGKEVLILQNADNLKRDTLMDIAVFKDLMNGTGVDVQLPERFPFITWMNAEECRFMYSNVYFQLNIRSKSMKVLNRIPKEGTDFEVDTTSKRIAFNMGDNLWAFAGDTYASYEKATSNVKSDGSASPKDFVITMDGMYGLQNGKAAHRNEFGILKGKFWSPAGNRLAFYKIYEGMVTDYPLLNLSQKPATPNNIKYPMAGATSHTARIQIYDFKRKIAYPIITGAPDEQYLTNISWSPNEEDIYVSIVNRDQNEMKFNKYDATTGAFIKTFFIETHAKYVEPKHPIVFLPKSNRYFIYQSERDGYNHLYLYEQNGKLVRQLSKGNFDVTELLGFNQTGTKAYYMATSNNGLDRQCFAVEIETGKTVAVTRNPGIHQVVFSDDGKYFLDSYSSLTTPRKTILTADDGLEKAVLLHASNPLMDYKPCSIRIFQLQSGDKTTPLNCRMFFPPNFDSTKKHPVLIYVYGGPHVQSVTNSWLGGADMWLYYMAQQGYVVFTMDNRGSDNRGLDFEQASFRAFGKVEREDQMTGVDFLTKQKYVDSKRMGVFGWSFGGFMTIGMMTHSPVFKAGVAGGPVIDWSLYEIMYTERYMDKPVENPEGYNASNLLNDAKNLKGDLLVIHGTDDETVVWQHSLQFIEKCVNEKVQVDYFVYPGHKHNVMGKDRVHLMQKITDYFKLHL